MYPSHTVAQADDGNRYLCKRGTRCRSNCSSRHVSFIRGARVHQAWSLPRKKAIQSSRRFTLRAVYSRTLRSARTVCESLSEQDLYSDDQGQCNLHDQILEKAEGKTIHDLLLRTDVQAVTIALPIVCQPWYIWLALSAGKHVLSEKPIAGDLRTGRELVHWYRTSARPKGLIWLVAENYRFLNAFQYGYRATRSLGALQSFELRKHWMQDERYLGSPYVLPPSIHTSADSMFLFDCSC